MTPRSTITSIDDLKRWWDADPTKPYWSLYRGLRYNKTDVLVRNTTIEDPDEAFKLLEDMIQVNGGAGGDFVIARSEKPLSNYVEKAYLSLHAHGAMPGVAGYPAPYPGMALAGIPAGKSLDDVLAERINSEREKWELSKKVEDLEGSIQGMQEGTGIERVFNRLLDHPKLDAMVDILLTRLLGPKPAPANVAVSGMPGEEEAHEGFQYDSNRVITALEQIREHFPDIHEFLDKLAAYIASNPGQAKMIFKSLG